jgi:hypothetical protein
VLRFGDAKATQASLPGQRHILHAAAGSFASADPIKCQSKIRLFPRTGLAKFHRLFVDSQNDTASFADYTMLGSWRVDDQSARVGRPVLITLRTREHQNMLITGMFMQRNPALGGIAKECRCWAGDSIPVQTVDLHAIAEWLPRYRARILGYLKEIRQFNPGTNRRSIRFHNR